MSTQPEPAQLVTEAGRAIAELREMERQRVDPSVSVRRYAARATGLPWGKWADLIERLAIEAQANATARVEIARLAREALNEYDRPGDDFVSEARFVSRMRVLLEDTHEHPA